MKTTEDIRNKLGPIKNLIALVENYVINNVENINVKNLLISEIEESKKSLLYLSQDTGEQPTEANAFHLLHYANVKNQLIKEGNKPLDIKTAIDNEKEATTFTEHSLKNVSELLSEDYKTGYKEGIQHYLGSKITFSSSHTT